MAVAANIGTAAHAPTTHAWAPAALACMGIVFGDIGTSPLYTAGTPAPRLIDQVLRANVRVGGMGWRDI